MQPEITQVIADLIANPPRGRRCISVKEAVALALEARPRSYGLSTEYALRRYRAIKRHGIHGVGPMWRELVTQVDSRLAAHPEEDDFIALEVVLATKAPSRYHLSPVYAEKAFYRSRAFRRRPRSLHNS